MRTDRRLTIKPISPLWYMAALFIALIGLTLGFSVAAGAWDSVRAAAITSPNQPVDANNRSVAVFTDVVQPDRRVTCRATTEADRKAKREPTEVPPAALDLVVNDDGNEWHLIGFIDEGRDGMEIRCTPKDKRTDNATYAVSVVDGFIDRVNRGKGIAYIAVAASAALAIWTFIERRRKRYQESDDAST